MGRFDVIRVGAELLSRGDVDRLMELYLPESEWVMPPEWPERRVYRGKERIRELAMIGPEGFDDYRFELERIVELDDGRALGLFLIRGNIKGSGVPLETEFGGIYTLRGEKFLRIEAFFSWADAIQAAGVGDRIEPPGHQPRSVGPILGDSDAESPGPPGG
jgi:ketosteroid isomerase-like protein